MAEPAVLVEKHGPVLTVTLNRPEKRNAINCESMCRLYDAWKQLDIQTSNFDFESEMLVAAGRKGLRVKSVPVSTVYGEEVSKINPVTDTIRFIKMVWRLWRSG